MIVTVVEDAWRWLCGWALVLGKKPVGQVREIHCEALRMESAEEKMKGGGYWMGRRKMHACEHLFLIEPADVAPDQLKRKAAPLRQK
ncbi:hypothetical protein [Shinella kummerowiae]|uniref:hypothetical protein n=1 Tax=Shinella kummerowiae TaxID=417745 RepID=UPI0021B5D693|nr:hypothetical protein [Shinella kummerowiae]MCT7667456.1 hypothetical protein [Shinella kummerowiae]